MQRQTKQVASWYKAFAQGIRGQALRPQSPRATPALHPRGRPRRQRSKRQPHGLKCALHCDAPADSVRLHETVPRPRPCSAARSFLRTMNPAATRALPRQRGLPARERPRHHEVPRLHRRRRGRRHDHGDGRARARAHVLQGGLHRDAPASVLHFTQPLWSKGMTRDSSSRSGGSIPSGGSVLARRASREGTRASSRRQQ